MTRAQLKIRRKKLADLASKIGVAEACQKFRCNTTLAYTASREFGIPFKPMRNGMVRHDPIRYQRIAFAVNRGLSMSAVGRIEGLTSARIDQIIKAQGIRLGRRKTVMECVDCGEKVLARGSHARCSKCCPKKCRCGFTVSRRNGRCKKCAGEDRRTFDYDLIESRYVGGESTVKIGASLGISADHVYMILRRSGVKTRTKMEAAILRTNHSLLT